MRGSTALDASMMVMDDDNRRVGNTMSLKPMFRAVRPGGYSVDATAWTTDEDEAMRAGERRIMPGGGWTRFTIEKAFVRVPDVSPLVEVCTALAIMGGLRGEQARAMGELMASRMLRSIERSEEAAT